MAERVRFATGRGFRHLITSRMTVSPGGAAVSLTRCAVNALAGLISELNDVGAGLPDRRKGQRRDGEYSLADIGLSAFSVFFMGSPSFLAHQRALEEGQGRSNCQTLFGMTAVPSDAYIRLMLDVASPAAFDPLFFKTIETEGVLAPFQRLGGRTLIALDGTEHICSR